MIKKKKRSSQLMPTPQAKKKCVTSDANKGKRILQAVSLPNSFKIPNHFRPDIQKKLEDPSAVFMPKDQSAFLREVANATQVYSYKHSQFQESANLERSIQQETRGAPFIRYIGSTINIILESKPFIRVRTTAEAVIALMATYYVFHLDYSAKVSNALLFLQSFVPGEKDHTNESYVCPRSYLL
ncbi:hypothetical protein DAPPUDRAFT_331237 [Daphnia pulex]|uniref:Uncharacterized protein n=1 Tax=Daphnia pulex TaxID=6669 RepID=E9HLW1_DAPPU|nr:hypothetical protein DAPPUDRAFT_331237 [Daphnia pulex]|eukprot:EFX67273.1 hypothetical protein DAPPUDRAFT_331237 [Daphnia pulex]